MTASTSFSLALSRTACSAALAAALFLSLSGCGSSASGGHGPPDRAAVNKAFQPVVDVGPPAPTRDLDVYIDGSESMKGFLAIPDSRFPAVVRHVLDHASTANYKLARYKFSSAINSVDSLKTSDILAEGFFNGADTPLSGLLTRIGEHPDRISVVISDLVLSDVGAEQKDLVAALSRLAAKHMEMRLLAFRSNFIGDYYPENRPNGPRVQKFHLEAKEGLPNTGRPFYLFVLAPDRGSLDLLQNYILQSASAPQTFSPTEAPFAIEKIEFRPAVPAEAIWNPFSRAEVITAGSGAVRQYGSFREYKAPKDKESPLRLQLSGALRTPFESLQRIHFRVRRAAYRAGRFPEPPAEVELPVTFEGGPTQSALSMKATYALRRPEAGGWDVYEIRMSAGEGNLACPQWVKNWSTEADDKPTNGNRTFQLALLVESMIRSITEANVFCEQYISVGRN